jgi:hypothetical protein
MNQKRLRGGRNNNNNNNNSGNNGGRRPHAMGSNRNYDSNGPDVKIRGTASHIYERYCQLARDANSAGDRIAAENYLQHAEHYYRIMLANGLAPIQQKPSAGAPGGVEGEQPFVDGAEQPAEMAPQPDVLMSEELPA